MWISGRANLKYLNHINHLNHFKYLNYSVPQNTMSTFLKSPRNSLLENVQKLFIAPHINQNIVWPSWSILFQKWQIYFIIGLDFLYLWSLEGFLGSVLPQYVVFSARLPVCLSIPVIYMPPIGKATYLVHPIRAEHHSDVSLQFQA